MKPKFLGCILKIINYIRTPVTSTDNSAMYNHAFERCGNQSRAHAPSHAFGLNFGDSLWIKRRKRNYPLNKYIIARAGTGTYRQAHAPSTNDGKCDGRENKNFSVESIPSNQIMNTERRG